MSFRVVVKDDIKQATRYFNRLEKRQIPFATAGALTDTGFDARKNLIKGASRDLDRPTPFTLRGFAVRRATKTRQVAEVFIRPVQDEYLQYSIEGGTRRPKGKVIIIGVGRRNKYGNTPGFRRLRSRLLGQKNTFEGEINGTAGIWKRQKNGVKLLARYVTHANYDKRFRFHERVAKTVKGRFSINFDRRLERALATAR